MTNVYDTIGSGYDSHRSDIGVCDVVDLAEQMSSSLHVLDLGCGTGHPIAIRVAPLVTRYLGIDNSEPMLRAYRKSVPEAECQFLDMEQIETIGGNSDIIFSWGAICHLPVNRQASTLTGASRLLNKHGYLMFTGGEEPGHCKGSIGPYKNVIDHYSMGKDGYKELLAVNGMTLVRAEIREGNNFTYLFEKMPNKSVAQRRGKPRA